MTHVALKNEVDYMTNVGKTTYLINIKGELWNLRPWAVFSLLSLPPPSNVNLVITALLSSE